MKMKFLSLCSMMLSASLTAGAFFSVPFEAAASEACIENSASILSVNSGNYDEERIHKVQVEQEKFVYNSAAHEKKCISRSRSVVYSHTPNIDDDGVQNAKYEHGFKMTDVVTIPGAESLHVTLTYSGESNSDWVSFWEGAHPEYTAATDYKTGIKTGESSNGQYSEPSGTVEYDIEGEAVTFAFKSNYEEYGSRPQGYGYYAVVSSNTVFEEVISSEIIEMTFAECEHSPASCTESEKPAGLVGSDGLYYEKDGDIYTQIFPEAASALGHSWNSESEYEWINNNSVCQEVQRCLNDSTHKRIARSADSMTTVNTSSSEVTYTAEFPGSTRYSHTDNIDDSGVQQGNYGNNLNTKDIVTIPGAARLHVKLTYGTENGNDFLFVLCGKYTGTVTPKISSDIYYKRYSGGSTDNLSDEFYVEGDTVTFAFYSNDEDRFYGYYAEISSDAAVISKTISLSDTHTVTWKDADATVLQIDEYVENNTPAEYLGETPAAKKECRTHYIFTGWSDGVNTYPAGEAMPCVSADTAYTAVYRTYETFYSGHALTLEGDIGVVFYLDLTSQEVENEASVHFTWANDKSFDYIFKPDDLVPGKGYMVKVYVSGAEMSYKIRSEITIGGEKQSEIEEYSVRDYALTIINSPDTFAPELVDLAGAMLDYGAKLQTVFEKTDAVPANEGIDYSMKPVTPEDIRQAVKNANDGAEQSDMTDNTDALGLTYYGTSIVCLSKTTLRHYYTVSDSEKFNAVKNSASFVYHDEKKPYIYFEMQDISADELDTLQELTIGGQTYRYSVLDNARKILESGNATTAYKNYAAAQYWYNHYADIYAQSQKTTQ